MRCWQGAARRQRELGAALREQSAAARCGVCALSRPLWRWRARASAGARARAVAVARAHSWVGVVAARALAHWRGHVDMRWAYGDALGGGSTHSPDGALLRASSLSLSRIRSGSAGSLARRAAGSEAWERPLHEGGRRERSPRGASRRTDGASEPDGWGDVAAALAAEWSAAGDHDGRVGRGDSSAWRSGGSGVAAREISSGSVARTFAAPAPRPPAAPLPRSPATGDPLLDALLVSFWRLEGARLKRRMFRALARFSGAAATSRD